MSNEFQQHAVSSMPSVISSIENDRQVYLWFLAFISLPEIQKKLAVRDRTKGAYEVLKKIQRTQIITYLVLGFVVASSCLIKQPWALLLGLLPLGVLINLFRKDRKHVGYISEQFLLANIQPDQLSRQTLFQTCEYFAKQYKTPSLVDTITGQDMIERKILLGSVLFLPFIHPFKTWQLLFAILVIFFTARAIINISIVLRKLQ